MALSHNESENTCSTDPEVKTLQEEVMYLQEENDKLWTKIEEIEGNYTSLFDRIRSWPFIKINVPAFSSNEQD